MSEFRFRAAAALELRRQQERAAAGDLARAEASLRDAHATLHEAERVRTDAANALVAVQCQGTDIATLGWHRNWIVRCADIAARQLRDVQTRAMAVQRAEEAWQEARRRHRALERLRDRAWRQYREAQERLELKRIDELARIRHLNAGDPFGGPERSDA